MPYRNNGYARKQFRPNIVFFDLETTGFDRPIRPVQVIIFQLKLNINKALNIKFCQIYFLVIKTYFSADWSR